MSDTPNNNPPPPTWNIANQVTAARLVASVILFILLHFANANTGSTLFYVALVLFLLAAATDWVDGYLARSRNLVTQLGRIMDPLADKIIICGTFVYLSALYPESGVAPWMTVVVICREFMVTVLRSFLEQNGKDFSAKMPGKLKMVFQCALVVASLLMLAHAAHGQVASWLSTTVSVLAWLTVASTIYSGFLYLPVAARELRDIP